MGSLKKSFYRDLPLWISTIREEVTRKVEASPLIQGCARGDKRYIKSLIVGYWWFVDQFPESIARARHRVLEKTVRKPKKIITKFGATALIDVLAIHTETTLGMQKDEKNHRALWLQTARAIGLEKVDLEGVKPLHEVRKLHDLIYTETDFFKIFLQFVAVEMVAEELSKVLLASSHFKAIVKGDGLRWFQVHVEHSDKGMSHEEMALRLAFVFRVLFQEDKDGEPRRGSEQHYSACR